MICPFCKATNHPSLASIHSSGKTRVPVSNGSGGVRYETQLTDLARRFAPPQNPMLLVFVAFMFGALTVYVRSAIPLDSRYASIPIVLIAIFALGIVIGIYRFITVHPAEIRIWRSSWYCDVHDRSFSTRA
jgi:VIT1/CCC1 family predicted Fe2+/Mn2+ transporter